MVLLEGSLLTHHQVGFLVEFFFFEVNFPIGVTTSGRLKKVGNKD
jgi:hypothetical protein